MCRRHPAVRVVDEDTPLPQALTPVYPSTAGVSQAYLRKAIDNALSRTALPELLRSARLGKRIREELAKTTFRSPNGALSVTCSVGVGTFPEAGPGWEGLFKAADEGLYVSKRSGRNKSTAWRPPSPRKMAVGAR